MLPRIFLIAAAAFGMVDSPSAYAQTQPQIQTLGSPAMPGAPGKGIPGPKPNKPTAAEKKAKRTACLKQARQQNLTGKARSTFVKSCTTGG